MADAREGVISSERLGRELGVNAVIVRRLRGPLRMTTLLEARSGPGGGWSLARDPGRIGLGELYRALHRADGTPGTRLDEVLRHARNAFVAELDRWTLADLLPVADS